MKTALKRFIIILLIIVFAPFVLEKVGLITLDSPRQGSSSSSRQENSLEKQEEYTKYDLIRLYEKQKKTNLSKMTLSKSEWVKGSYVSTATFNFIIRNDIALDVKDIVVNCNFYGKSDTLIGSRRATIYDRVQRSSSRRFPNIEMGLVDRQSASASCEIVDFEYDMDEISRKAMDIGRQKGPAPR